MVRRPFPSVLWASGATDPDGEGVSVVGLQGRVHYYEGNPKAMQVERSLVEPSSAGAAACHSRLRASVLVSERSCIVPLAVAPRHVLYRKRRVACIEQHMALPAEHPRWQHLVYSTRHVKDATIRRTT
jgi:hypothetical protein